MSTIMKRLLKDSSSLSTGMLYGIINGIMCIPVSISFCSIIYRDKGFEEYLPQLVKLVLFSSMIHQWAFTTYSSLPFAIGQVQDAGLIFLSSMAADIVQNCDKVEQIVPTTIVVLPICTFILGCMLVVVAKLKLATVIQYLPMPVIGGYLAFIGFFCGQAGLAMMAGVQVTNLSEWGNFCSTRALILLAPGVICGVTTYHLLCRVHSPYVLPFCMLSIITIFFSLLLLSGTSLEDAREFGWISPLTHPEPFYQSWQLYDFSLVDWKMLPQQFLRLISMFLVVAFSSSLDVAAIEMEMGLPLDYNRELNTVGIANVFSGLTGGYTGSYIFSQTIFTMRRGVYSRVSGYTVALCEGLMIMLPFSIISYLPKLFFGSLLVLISVDLMTEWLVAARKKMAPMEFAVCLLTFFAIQATGIEIGMFIGILLAMASFVVTYSRLQTVSSASLQTSTVIRTFEERASLIAQRGKVVTITLKGYIFFGSAVKILEDIKTHVSISVPELTPQELMQQQQQDDERRRQNAAQLSQQVRQVDDVAITEHTSLLSPDPQQRKGYSELSPPPSRDLVRKDGPRMSFRVPATVAGSSKPRQINAEHHYYGPPSQVGGMSVMNRLFSDAQEIGGASGCSSNSDAAIHSPASGSPLKHSDSLSVRPNPIAGHATSLSVYDMSPDTLKRMIEERSQLDSVSASYGGYTARERCTGSGHINSLSLPTNRTCPASDGQKGGGYETPTNTSDIEMGKMKNIASPGAKSLLTERLEDLQQAPVSATVSVSSTLNPHSFSPQVVPINVPIHTTAPAERKDNSYKQIIPRRQSKVATSGAATYLQEESARYSASNSSATSSCSNRPSRDNSGVSKVSFDESLPDCMPREDNQSLLALVFAHQRDRQTISADLAYRKDKHPDAFQIASAISTAAHGESVEHILRTRSDSRDNSGERDGEGVDLAQMPMMRERRFQDTYSTHKQKRRANSAELHMTAAPPPEIVLGRLSAVQEVGKQLESAQEEVMTEYLVLDFSAVVGVDATATRSCFLMMVQLMRSAKVTVVFANMNASLEALFRVHKVIGDNDVVIPLLDDALEWCEERVLINAGQHHAQINSKHTSTAKEQHFDPQYALERNSSFYSRAAQQRRQVASSRGRSGSRDDLSNAAAGADGQTAAEGKDVHKTAAPLQRILEDYLEVTATANPRLQQLLRADLLSRYFQRTSFPALEVLFDTDEPADKIYFIESGEVEIVSVGSVELGFEAHPESSPGVSSVAASAAASASAIQSRDTDGGNNIDVADVNVVRVNKVQAGGAFGEADFLLGKNHSVQAHTMAKSVFWTLNREQYARMEVEAPSLCLLIQHTLLKSLAIASTCALHAQHPSHN